MIRKRTWLAAIFTLVFLGVNVAVASGGFSNEADKYYQRVCKKHRKLRGLRAFICDLRTRIEDNDEDDDGGEQGPPGEDGEKGEKGDPGEKGEKGDVGVPRNIGCTVRHSMDIGEVSFTCETREYLSGGSCDFSFGTGILLGKVTQVPTVDGTGKPNGFICKVVSDPPISVEVHVICCELFPRDDD